VRAKSVRRHAAIPLLLVVALLASIFGMAFATTPVVEAQPQNEVRVQMVVCVDGSGSIGAPEFDLMREGLALAVENPAILPQDGSVELGVNIFGWSSSPHAEVVVPMTVIDSQTTADAVAAAIRAMTQPTGWTPTGAAITLATQMMQGSANWGVAELHIINISTDGHPEPDNQVATAEAARNAAITAGITHIYAEAIGVEAQWLEWMRANIVYPEPGVIAPPYPEPPGSQGFVRVVESFEQYEEAIAEKFREIIPPDLLPTDDSFTDQRIPYRNYGRANTLWAYSTHNKYCQFDRYMWLKFDVTEISPETVESATLVLHVYTSWGFFNPADREFGAYLGEDDWDELTINWLNQPAILSGPEDTVVAPASFSVIEFDVTEMMKQEADGDGILTVVIMSEEKCLFDYLSAYSKENPEELRPCLHIEYA
jgi:hypothetical protein